MTKEDACCQATADIWLIHWQSSMSLKECMRTDQLLESNLLELELLLSEKIYLVVQPVSHFLC